VAGGARAFSLRRELGLFLAVYGVYLLVRKLVLARGGRERGLRNARRVVDLEERLGMHMEPTVQSALLRVPRVVRGLNVGYAVFNVSLTVGWLIVLFRARDPRYHVLRRACVLAHVGAQPVFLLFPTSPPRALDGYVDTLSELSGLDLEHPLLVRFYNPVAAMPSLHVAFATITGAAMAESAGSAVGTVAARAYAPLVALVVAGTGNHYVLDAVVGAALGRAVWRFA
jgi:hypothetical protein